MPEPDTRWVALLTAPPGSTIEVVLGLSLGLDVWERVGDRLTVAADDGRLREVERRGLARVERLETVQEYLTRHGRPDGGGGSGAPPSPGDPPGDPPGPERGQGGT